MPIRIVLVKDNGEHTYEVPEPMTYRELGKIKRITGLRGGEIGEALMAGDTDAILAITVIASERANDPVTLDDLEDMPFGSIRVEAEEDEDPSQAAEADAGNGGTDAQVTPVDGGTPDSQGSTE